MMFESIPNALPFVRKGQNAAIGVTTMERSSSVPDIMTLAEQGLPNYDVSAWTGLFIPAGTPRAIINRLNDETGKISHDRAYVARIQGMATEVVAVSTPEAFGAFVRDNVARWNKVIDGAGISRIE